MKYHLKSILFLLTLIFIWLSVLAASAYQGRIVLIVLNMLASLSAIAWLFALMHDKFEPSDDESHYLSDSEIADIKRSETPVVTRSSLSAMPSKHDVVDDVVALSAISVAVSAASDNDMAASCSSSLTDVSGSLDDNSDDD